MQVVISRDKTDVLGEKQKFVEILINMMKKLSFPSEPLYGINKSKTRLAKIPNLATECLSPAPTF